METLVVTLTLSTVMSFLALTVGIVIGWVARQHSYETTPQTFTIIQKCMMQMETLSQTKSSQ